MQTVPFVKLKNAHPCKGFRENAGLTEERETGVADEPQKETVLISQMRDRTCALLRLQYSGAEAAWRSLLPHRAGRPLSPILIKAEAWSI